MSNFGNMLQEHFVTAFRENSAVRTERLRKITTRQQAEEYVAGLREKVRRTYSFPAEKCPLRPRISTVRNYPGFSVENIIIDSRPDFPVTMSLFLPEKFSGKLPVMIVLCGHAESGKGYEPYYTLARTMALNGGAGLIVDPIHQGERVQYPPEEDPWLCNLHNRFNCKLKACNDNFGNWRVYDVIRCLDYLFTRQEIDPEKIGVSGTSGGGTLTTLAAACDERISLLTPSSYITRWRINVENELPIDGEQIPPGFAADGGEMSDLLLAAAPTPVLIHGQEDDFFDIRGTREAYEEIRYIYELLGYGDRVKLFIAPGSHGLYRDSRNAITEFYAEHFGISPAPEKDLPALPQEELFCIPDGTMLDKTSYKFVMDLIEDNARKIASERPVLSDEELKQKLRKLLQIDTVSLPSYRQLRPSRAGDKFFNRYALEVEKDILVTLKSVDTQMHYSIQPVPAAELYIPHQDTASELKDRNLSPERLLYGLDYRGVGESMPESCDQWEELNFFSEYHFDYHYDSLYWLLGKSMTGKRVKDILSAIELLYCNGTTDILLSASGIGMIPAIFAAFLSGHPVKLKLFDKVTTYLDNCLSCKALLPQSMVPEGILTITDLDDILNRLDTI